MHGKKFSSTGNDLDSLMLRSWRLHVISQVNASESVSPVIHCPDHYKLLPCKQVKQLIIPVINLKCSLELTYR